MKYSLLLLSSLLLMTSAAHAQTLLQQYPTFNGPVLAVVKSGNTVYVGGEFTSIGGQMRPKLAAVNPATGDHFGVARTPAEFLEGLESGRHECNCKLFSFLLTIN